MRNYDLRKENGAISVFVMFAMLFFVVTMLGVYMIGAKRAQTQTETVGIIAEKYYSEGEEASIYNSKIAGTNETIPIYSKEQLWSIGDNVRIEIEGKVYDFSTSDLSKYQLKNDIIINIATDLASSRFKDNFVFGATHININNCEVLYYYEGKYYVPVSYSNGSTITNLGAGTAVLSASGNNFSTISTKVTGLTGKYYLFAVK